MTQELALLYARVSTNRQGETGHSLDSQSALLVKQSETEGYKVELILENGSGRKSNRPKLNEALDRLNRGEAQALFAVDSDRLARSTMHLYQISEHAKRNNWRLVITSLQFDTKSSHGKMTMGMLAVFAEFESDIIAERVKRQHQARRDRGEVWGLTQGYKGNLSPKTRQLIVKEREAGKSLRAIIQTLEAKGHTTPRGGKWQPATVKAILDSPQSKVLVRG
jgi:DNA invertase Pin-like site-specific DNA recombinase